MQDIINIEGIGEVLQIFFWNFTTLYIQVYKLL